MKKLLILFPLLLLMGGVLLLNGCKKQPPAPPKEVSNTSSTAAKTPVATDGKIEMSLYYAGHPDSKREKDFVDFLNKHFTKIETGDLAAFDGSQSEGFGVTILDYDGDGFKSPKPDLPLGFDRPLLTMGVTGAFICSHRSLAPKLDYL